MSAISHATTRKTPGGGGFLLGMFVGLLVGLAVALGIALYLNKTPIPFTSRKPAADDTKSSGMPARRRRSRASTSTESSREARSR